MRPSLLPLVLLASVTPANAQAPRVRDSAGVHIVENASRLKAPVAFTLSAKPTHDVGGIKDNPDDELNKNSAYLKEIRLSDGRYVVDDLVRLLVVDASGKTLHVIGRQGHGPGEFQYVDAVCRVHGDTIIVDDPGNARVTVFDKTGAMVREIPVGRTYMLRNGCFDDGTFVLDEAVHPAEGPGTTNLVHRALDGTVLGSAGSFSTRPVGIFVADGLLFAAHGQYVYVADPQTGKVGVYNPQGKLTAFISTADAIQKTTAAEQATMVPMYSVMTTDQAILDRYKERVRTEPRPATWPAFRQMMIDPEGRLWLLDYSKVRTDPDWWTAFDASGHMLGRFMMPSAQKSGDPRVVSFTSGGVSIVHDDDDGAHHLTTYALVPASGRKP